MTTLRRTAMGMVGALLACGSCSHEPQSPEPVTSIQPPPTLSQRAENPHNSDADRLAAARCDREQTCGNIGLSQRYTSRHECIAQVQNSVVNDLAAYDCPRGLDPNAVTACVNAIGTEACSQRIDTIASVGKCRHDAVCP
jgi:hypothetical protein